MKHYLLFPCLLALSLLSTTFGQKFPLPEKSVAEAFAGKTGALVFINTASGATATFNSALAAEPLPPCSTFKIWNTLIGLENGILHSANEPFYQWDGKKRFLPEWNQDLTLKQAFQFSCVPAFQALARKIGKERMQLWIDKLGYGDRDTSAGIDVFWLPAPDRKTILISPTEQAELLAKLVDGKLPVSAHSREVLAEVMLAKPTANGALYGKTGTGTNAEGKYNLGWYAGYLISHGRTYTFACVLKGDGVMGKDARAIVENIAAANGYF